MEISIQTDMTQAGTKVSVDNKQIKKIEHVSFSMYDECHYDTLTQSYGEPFKVISCRVRTEETDENGVEREVTYEFEKHGDTIIKDSRSDASGVSVQDAVNTIMGQLGARKF